ncbi:accessory gene regulator B family protein [Ruminiclostridium herbifermentans]|uniref:Accessory gene regulator B family protein n=1 Tax=Ruminiclostridium herbifermentans TaxID=2488810 RepID=A0A4V6END2_9FIRM|nr:accessory gene regulator B family protein [Ruminiclostridium herbifermentans]QNU66896.1 accessory gene regulator B family protein [Ruminiclostridium herbifermentans]
MEITFYRKLANKLADTVVKNQDYSEQEEKRIRHGLVCILSDLYKFILIFLIFFCFSLTKECFIAFIGILMLRPFLAGYHAKNEFLCIFISLATIAISIFVGKLNIIPDTLNIILIILLPIVGLIIAPVRTKKVEEKKTTSKALTVLLTILALILDYFLFDSQILLVSILQVYILALYQLVKNQFNNRINNDSAVNV